MMILKERLKNYIQNKNCKLPENLPLSLFTIEEIKEFESHFLGKIEKFVELCGLFEIECRKHGLESVKNSNEIGMRFLYKLASCYFDTREKIYWSKDPLANAVKLNGKKSNYISDDRVEKYSLESREILKEYIKKVFIQSRLKSTLLLYMDIMLLTELRTYSSSYVELGNYQLFFRGVVVEYEPYYGSLPNFDEYKKIDPLSWMENLEGYKLELELSKKFIEDLKKGNKISYEELGRLKEKIHTPFIKNIFDSVDTYPDEITLDMIIYPVRVLFIKKYVEVVKENTIWYIKEKSLFNADKKIVQFKQNYKEFEDMINFFN